MRYSICKIENKNGDGTGFFCQKSDKKLLITNNHVINEEIIKDNKIIKVKLNDNKIKKDIKIEDYYTSIEYDTTIIEINPVNDNIHNYLELDDQIFDDFINIFNKSVYILQYPKSLDGQKAAVSYGIIKNIDDDYNIIHYCSTDHGSSGSPIIRLSNKKIIGIHKEGISNKNYNRGTLLKYPINEYLNKYFNNKKNEINLTLKIKDQDDINYNRNIYFLIGKDYNNVKGYEDSFKYFNKLLNESKIDIFINEKKYENKNYFNPTKIGEYKIKLIFKIDITNMSFMFYDCYKITNIDFTYFETKNATNMSYMFHGCGVESLDLSSFDTKNVTNMSHMFCMCGITNLNLSSFDTKNVTNMSSMFYECRDLRSINLSSFDTKNVTDMSYMFCLCGGLQIIDLSSFEDENLTDNTAMFDYCPNLKIVIFNNKLSNNKIKSEAP